MLLLALLICAGCGVQGVPLPPLLNLPQPAELHLIARGDRVLISWAMPRLTTEEQAVEPGRLGPAGIYLAVLPGLRANVSVTEFQTAAQRIGTVAVADLQKPSVEYAAKLPADRAGNTAAYGVKLPNDRGHDAGFSNIVSLPILRVLPAPATLSAEQERDRPAILVQWPAVEGASAYAVYRSAAGGPFELRSEVTGGRYEDQAFEFNTDYSYLVRSVRKDGEFRAESADSPVKTVKTADVYVLPSPTGLVAVATAGAVQLSWEPSPQAELAGYNVYRSESGNPAQRLNKELAVSPTFSDTDVRPGVTYTYSVTAVKPNSNESPRSEPAIARP